MRIKILIVALFALGASAACGIDARLDPVDSAALETKTYDSTAIVTKIDVAANMVTLDHDDIPGYMKAMSMTEKVKSPEILNGIRVGDRVEFEIERTGSEIIITKLTKVSGVGQVNGAEVFKANCARCHGDSGEGTKKGIPLVTGHALHHSAEEYVQRVTNGKDPKMPAFGGKLSDSEIKAVVDYVRGTIQAGAKDSESSEHHKH